MHVFLHAPEHFENLCGIARTLDVLGLERCYVYDPHELLEQPKRRKSRARQGKAVSAGAFERVEFVTVSEPRSFLASLPGRMIATGPGECTRSLLDLKFLPSDTIVFGSESRGLPTEIFACADETVSIPQRGVTRSLNLSVAVGIVLYEWLRQAS